MSVMYGEKVVEHQEKMRERDRKEIKLTFLLWKETADKIKVITCRKVENVTKK